MQSLPDFGLNRLLVAVALIVIIFGTGVAAYSMSGPSMSVVASSVSVDCSGYPSSGCVVNALVDNTGTSGFASPFTAYFVYKNSLGQTVLIDQHVWTTQSLVTDTFPSTLPGEGTTNLGYSVTVFFWDANGLPMGTSATKSFGVPLHFTIDYCDVGTVTVSPAGTGSTTGSASGVVGCSYYAAYWPSGTQLTVTTSAGVAPVDTAPSGGSDCPASGSGFVCTLKVSELTGLPIIEGAGAAVVSQDSIVVQSAVASAPASICLSSSEYTSTNALIGSCSPTGSFTLSVPQGYTWSGDLWSVVPQGGGGTVASGNSTDVSLSYSDLSSKVSFDGGVAYLELTEASLAPTGGPGGPNGNGGSSCVLSPSSNAALDVFVVNQGGNPVVGAMVTGAGASAITDAQGEAVLCNFPVPSGNLIDHQGEVTVSVEAQGYSPKSQQADVVEGQTSQATVQLSGGGFSNPIVLAGVGVAAVGIAAAFAGVSMGRGPKR